LYHLVRILTANKKIEPFQSPENYRSFIIQTMYRLFNPSSITIIGVSEKSDNLGRIIVENMLRFGYPGKLYLVGRQQGNLHGLPIVTIEQLPQGIDLAVLLIPATTVPAQLEACGKLGIPYAIIESGGFSEYSAEGKHLEQECLDVAHRYGMRLVGPNCIGIANLGCGLLTNFVPTEKDEILLGRISLLSQSGGVVMTCANLLSGDGLGLSKTVSLGNKIDLQEIDFVEYYLDDPDTDVILLYLESILDGRRLVEKAMLHKKPLLVYKSNTTPSSATIAASHTAALVNDEAVIDAAYKQSGILRLQTFSEMVNYAKGFAMPPVRGKRLAVFSRSGGYAIVAADQAAVQGFELPPLNPDVLEVARTYFRVSIMNENNPLDLGTIFDFNSFPVIIEACMQAEPKPDAVMLIFNYQHRDEAIAHEVASRLVELSRRNKIPIALVYFSGMDDLHVLRKNLGYPVFLEVADAMRALAASREFYTFRPVDESGGEEREHEIVDEFRVVPKNRLLRPAKPALNEVKGTTGLAKTNDEAQAILTTCLAENRQPLVHEALEICRLYELQVAPFGAVDNPAKARALAMEIGYPLALKVISSTISHKSDAGGVVLNLTDEATLMQAIAGMTASLGREYIEGFLLQKMAQPGRELILGGKRDPAFGPVVLIGLGGIFVEVLRDSVLRLAPLSLEEAGQMIQQLRGYPLLAGVRGQPPADLKLIAGCLVKLSRMLVDLPQIQEIDLNPLLVYPSGGALVDARIGLVK
jgi:acyl-CoA synthetase (NDP forming)